VGLLLEATRKLVAEAETASEASASIAPSVPPSAGTVPPEAEPRRTWPRVAMGAAVLGLAAAGALGVRHLRDAREQTPPAQSVAGPAAPPSASVETTSATAPPSASATPSALPSASSAPPASAVPIGPARGKAPAPRRTPRPQPR
jgi:hypothetical protein